MVGDGDGDNVSHRRRRRTPLPSMRALFFWQAARVSLHVLAGGMAVEAAMDFSAGGGEVSASVAEEMKVASAMIFLCSLSQKSGAAVKISMEPPIRRYWIQD
uniref:Uncharacterized protein n=1 Tax=Leersia perrieri TaxID=77586 RepID=A0A0D9V1C9_9ORYZ